MNPLHNKQIKKDARSAPIIKGVMSTIKLSATWKY